MIGPEVVPSLRSGRSSDRHLLHRRAALPVSEAIHREARSLALSLVMTDGQVTQVIEAVNRFQPAL